MDKLSILFTVKAEQVTGVYNHYWILYKYGMLECWNAEKVWSNVVDNYWLGL